MELTAGRQQPFSPTTRAELLAGFEERATEARLAVVSAPDEHLAKPWGLTFKGQEVFAVSYCRRPSVTKCIIARNSQCICD